MEKIESYQTRVSNLEQILDEVSNNSEKFELGGELKPIDFIKNKVSKLNDQEFKDVYLKFLEMFDLFWKDIYSKLCVEEIKQIGEQSYQKSRCSFAFDYNEMLKPMLSNSRLFDKYYSMFRNLASLFSEKDIRMFFEKHLMLFSKLHFFEMNVETNEEYGNDVTYRFDIHSRTDRAYHAFIKMFDEERKAGKRNSPLINNDELKNYVKKSLSKYNSYISDLYPEKVAIGPVSLFLVNIEGVEYFFDINEVSFEYINNFINDPRLQERYRRYHEEFIGSVGDGCFGIYDEAFLDDDIYINLDLDNENNRRMDQCFGISSWVDPALFPIFGESLLFEDDIKLVQKGIVFVNRYYGKEGLSKIRGFGFGNTATNLPFYIGFDDLKDEYEGELDGGNSIKKWISLKKDYYPVLKRIKDVFSCDKFLNWQNENAKSALFFIPQLLYDENGEFLDEISIVDLLMRITEQIWGNEDGKLDFKAFYKACEVCGEIYLEGNLYKYKKNTGVSKDLVKLGSNGVSQ